MKIVFIILSLGVGLVGFISHKAKALSLSSKSIMRRIPTLPVWVDLTGNEPRTTLLITQGSTTGICQQRKISPISKQLIRKFSHKTSLHLFGNNNNDESSNTSPKKGFGNFFNIYPTEIPDEIRDEIMKAEANTPAAKDRNVRITIYTIVALLTILSAFFNAFASELKSGVDPDMPSIQEAGFGWVVENPLASFFFLNKIGGFLLLAVGGVCGLLAESELDTRRINAEKIFQELKRRKEIKESKESNLKTVGSGTTKKRRAKSKETKRIIAFSEVIDTNQDINSDGNKNLEPDASSELRPTPPQPSPSGANEADTVKDEGNTKSGGGVLETVKMFYKRADQMAASQALLLNKKLEEQGVLEKITDETGLRVIGKEKAAEVVRKKGGQKNPNSQESNSE